MNNRLHIICLTKSYNKVDFQYWYSYYKSFGKNAIIHVIDNDSSVELFDIIDDNDTYEKIFGWPNQWVLFTDILNKNKYGFLDGDYVIFADDDEYYWFEYGWKDEIHSEFNQEETKILCIPQIYMSYKELPEYRAAPYVMTALYRRNDYTSQGKCIIEYDHTVTYSFKEPDKEMGHIPFFRHENEPWKRLAKCPESGYTATTYGITAYDAGIRLYHYHLKSMDDWKKKWERGSAACKKQPYDKDIKNNPGYDKYSVFDNIISSYIENSMVTFIINNKEN